MLKVKRDSHSCALATHAPRTFFPLSQAQGPAASRLAKGREIVAHYPAGGLEPCVCSCHVWQTHPPEEKEDVSIESHFQHFQHFQ